MSAELGTCEVQVESQIYVPSVSICDSSEERSPMEELDDAEGLLGRWGAAGDAVQSIVH